MPSVTMKQDLPASAEQLWQMLGNFNSLAEWHPAIANSKLSEEEGAKIRRLQLQGGGEIVERLEEHDDGARRYSYSILSAGPLPVANYQGSITVRPDGNGATVEWSSEFEAEGASEDEAVAAIRQVYEAGFENLKRMFGAR